MKLRNKKTGEKVDAWSFYDGYQGINLKYFTDDGQINLEYRSLAKLNKDWEDYATKEPLIKDEKIRKAVRAWAEAIDATSLFVEQGNFDDEFLELSNVISSIRFAVIRPKDIKAGERYTIAELCGEEES